MKIKLFCLLLAIGLFACGSESANSTATESDEKFTPADVAVQTKAYEDMMDLHDRVMPKMGNIAKMQKMLKDKMANADAETKAELQGVNNMLEKSYDGMMNWMRGLKSMDDLQEMESQEDILAYVKKETVRMNEVEELLEKGMAMSYQMLGIDPADMEVKEHHDHSHGDHDHSGHDHNHGDHDHSGHDH